jgi:hypothetical protein
MNHGSIIVSQRANSSGNMPSKKFKNHPPTGILMLTAFLDSQGPVLEYYQKRGTTINSAHCSEMLTDRLQSEI